jgi:cell division protein FtsQ
VKPPRRDPTPEPRNKRVRARPEDSRPQEKLSAPRVPIKARFNAVLGRLKRPVGWAFRGLLALAIGAGAIALGRLVERHVRTSPSFAVATIEVHGHARLSQEEIIESAGLALGRNVFDVSPEQAQQALNAHPWIARAQVRRRLPGTYQIEVRERRPVAVLMLEDPSEAPAGPFLIADDGAVFKAVEAGDPVDLPVITGVDRARFVRDRSFRASILLEIVALMHDYRGGGLWMREPIAEVHVERDEGLSLYAGNDSAYVRLGHGPYRPKLARLRRVLDELGARGARPAYVYLDNERRPDRVTVRVRDPQDG